MGVGMLDRTNGFANADVNRQLLRDLSPQRGRVVFAGFYLAAWKLPQPAQHAIERPARDQEV